MPKRTDISRLRAVTLAMVVVVSTTGYACEYSTVDIQVGSRFRVKARNGTTPLAGLTIEVETNPGSRDEQQKTIRTAVTGAGGFVEFGDVPEGRYFVIIRHPAVEKSVAVKVLYAAKDLRDEVSFDWPGDVLKTRNFVGRIRAPRKTESVMWDLAHPEWQLLSSTQLVIEDPITTRKLRTITTNSGGEFNAELPPGLYLIRVEKNDKFRVPEGVFAVELDPTSLDQVLNVRLTNGCGGLYCRSDG